MPAGRPTKLTPELIEEFRRHFPVALYAGTVAAYLGVGTRSIWRWLRRGQLEAVRMETDGKAKLKQSEALYIDFWHTYKKGLAEGEMFAIGVIRGAASKRPAVTRTVTKKAADGTQTVTEETEYFQPQWTAAAWLAERRYRTRWGIDRHVLRELRQRVRELEKTLDRLRAKAQEPDTAT